MVIWKYLFLHVTLTTEVRSTEHKINRSATSNQNSNCRRVHWAEVQSVGDNNIDAAESDGENEGEQLHEKNLAKE